VPSLISKWLRTKRVDGAEAFRGRGNRMALGAENERLKGENQNLKTEQEILRNASAYFAKNMR
jgi:transposase-like protein